MNDSRHLSVEVYATGVVAGDRAVLGRALTLVESNREDHQEQAQELLSQLMPRTGGAVRVGISGVPGVGKSTFIEALGTRLTARGHRVAVLAVDPTSTVSGGSILGDKTRMTRLSRDPAAFVRPSPTGGSLGGVGRKSRETLLVCEAAGFDVVLVETVGVGQSETLVAEMVDCFLVLMLAGAGDELQGIKRGILELADILAIHKADGDNREAALAAQADALGALRLMRSPLAGWQVPVLATSAIEGHGIDEVWEAVEEHHRRLKSAGELEARRRRQRRGWLRSLIEEGLLSHLRRNPRFAERLPDLERRVLDGEIPAARAAREILSLL